MAACLLPRMFMMEYRCQSEVATQILLVVVTVSSIIKYQISNIISILRERKERERERESRGHSGRNGRGS